MEHHILIIEDEVVVCDMLTRFLEKKQYQVACAQTLADGFIKLQSFLPAIVLLDNNLPDGKGVDQIVRLKELQPDLRIIVVSAMDSVHLQALANGAEQFIKKPFGFRQIEQAIQV